jgi:hypothetical protein
MDSKHPTNNNTQVLHLIKLGPFTTFERSSSGTIENFQLITVNEGGKEAFDVGGDDTYATKLHMTSLRK